MKTTKTQNQMTAYRLAKQGQPTRVIASQLGLRMSTAKQYVRRGKQAYDKRMAKARSSRYKQPSVTQPGQASIASTDTIIDCVKRFRSLSPEERHFVIALSSEL